MTGTVQRMIHQGRGGGEAFIASNANVITAQKQQINTGVVMPGFTPGHSAAINTHLPYNSKPPIVSLKNFVSSNLHVSWPLIRFLECGQVETFNQSILSIFAVQNTQILHHLCCLSNNNEQRMTRVGALRMAQNNHRTELILMVD